MKGLYLCLSAIYIVDAFEMSRTLSCAAPRVPFLEQNDCADGASRSEPPVAVGVGGQLVLYQPTFLEPFKLKQRTFKFAGKDIVINQNWEDLGVAAVVWDAAIVLSEYLEKLANDGKISFKNKKIIELGAGTGLVGIVTAVLGGDVTLTDRQLALECLEENTRINVESLNTDTELGGRIKVKELVWGNNLKLYTEAFDIILGADIVYIEDTFKDLLATLIHLTSLNADNKRTVIVYLSCRIRYEKDQTFLDTLEKHFDIHEDHFDLHRGIKVYKAMVSLEK